MSTYTSFTNWEKEVTKIKQQANEVAARTILDALHMDYSEELIRQNPIGLLLFGYAVLNKEKKQNFIQLLNQHQYNYSLSIRHAIMILLGKQNEIGESPKPEGHPGIVKIQNSENMYTVDTFLGKIHVNKASKVFEQDNIFPIFNRQLVGACFARTLEFVAAYPDDYKAVILSSPDFLSGTVYHAYAEAKETIVDLAANAYYSDKKDAEIPLQGEIIAKLSYDEITDKFDKIPKEYDFLINEDSYDKIDKIYCLAKYYAHQRDSLPSQR